MISGWATQTDGQRRAAGEEVGLHRVPCPEVALVRVFVVGESARGEALAKAALLIVMMLFWLRGASVVTRSIYRVIHTGPNARSTTSIV